MEWIANILWKFAVSATPQSELSLVMETLMMSKIFEMYFILTQATAQLTSLNVK